MAANKEQMMMMFQQMMLQQQQMQQEQQEMNEVIQTAGAIDNILKENIQLKKQINLDKVRNEKNKLIKKARGGTVNFRNKLNKKRTAKKRGGSKK
jgi:hypothetical protein